jgi:hypothetical protein
MAQSVALKSAKPIFPCRRGADSAYGRSVPARFPSTATLLKGRASPQFSPHSRQLIRLQLARVGCPLEFGHFDVARAACPDISRSCPLWCGHPARATGSADFALFEVCGLFSGRTTKDRRVSEKRNSALPFTIHGPILSLRHFSALPRADSQTRPARTRLTWRPRLHARAAL